VLILGAMVGGAVAQKATPKQLGAPIIFAVLHDGGTLEPIAYVQNKKLETAVDGSTDEDILAKFHGTYFRPKTSYQLIFGGVKAGTVAIKSSDYRSECSRHTAEIFAVSTRAKLKGNVMALAASSALKVTGSGVRRLPTAEERAEVESLARAEFLKQKITPVVVRKMKYQNLTAVDIDDDDIAEFVGTFWAAPTAKSRALLFFIAEKGTDEKYSFAFSDYQAIEEADTMSKDISSVDSGVYHELLLDILDYDGDGSSEIFTYSPSFEGAGFNAYRREDGKWVKAFEGANYRCGY